ncbi:uncharacterized protein EDB91DRAFT_457285 [Suillus paluster]|uniref:uncharacterized protein n=1 Tax=Suillus paluster TaxID=48578 RepID=UPI001B8637BF|nr:uncharacterized protein EDB91DRAFT_457285 [Suillus paluster]KAG1738376.1 hypothetical protein EDB91DRAFT_457285 [Suillus paluster]
MTLVSNDPSWWPVIIASSAVVIYDCVLTLGQEVELIWRQRWSLMTILYLSVRYAGIPYAVIFALYTLPSFSVSISDAVSDIMYFALNVTNVVVAAILGVIMVARLHAMYQGSRKMLIFLIVSFLAINVTCGVITAIGLRYLSGEELILSGTYMCTHYYKGDVNLLIRMVWTLNTVWEVLALFLAVWIAGQYFFQMRRLEPSRRLTIGNCFAVLIKSHMIYFASFAAVSCLQLGYLSPMILNSSSTGAEIYSAGLQIFRTAQMFVLGPRLILSVREYHAKLVADSDAKTSVSSIAFQHQRVHVSTSSGV